LRVNARFDKLLTHLGCNHFRARYSARKQHGKLFSSPNPILIRETITDSKRGTHLIIILAGVLVIIDLLDFLTFLNSFSDFPHSFLEMIRWRARAYRAK